MPVAPPAGQVPCSGGGGLTTRGPTFPLQIPLPSLPPPSPLLPLLSAPDPVAKIKTVLTSEGGMRSTGKPAADEGGPNTGAGLLSAGHSRPHRLAGCHHTHPPAFAHQGKDHLTANRNPEMGACYSPLPMGALTSTSEPAGIVTTCRPARTKKLLCQLHRQACVVAAPAVP